MTRRLLATYLLLTLVVLLALEVPLALGYRDHEIDALRADVQRDAFVLASYVADDLAGVTDIDLDTVVTNYTDRTGGRAVIVDADGDVVADSEPAAVGPRNFASRPEIATALGGEVAEGTRWSATSPPSAVAISGREAKLRGPTAAGSESATTSPSASTITARPPV
ncbi:MAG: hypothetical protein ACKOIA_00935, partial [Acidimicrobiia bacterium]